MLIDEKKGKILRDLVEKLWPVIESGSVRPLIYKTLPMADAATAHAILERNENIGKVILTVIPE